MSFLSKQKKQEIRVDHVTRRAFNYALHTVNLNFSLRVDIREEMESFIKLLENALYDVSKELSKLSEE